MAPRRPPPPNLEKPILELEITVVSAKNLKNVNWRSGRDLKPYAVAYLDPDRRSATKPDGSGSTKPVWNERLVLPLPLPLNADEGIALTIDVFLSKPSETPKPLVGTARVPLRDLLDPSSSVGVRTLDVLRPSGRPHGKLRIKISLRERPVPPPPPSPAPPPLPIPICYYSSTAPPPPMAPRDYRSFSHQPPPRYPYSSGTYSDPYSSSPGGYGYYSTPPPPPTARPPMYYARPVPTYGGGTSAPADYAPSNYEQKLKGGGWMGMRAGLAVGAVAGAIPRSSWGIPRTTWGTPRSSWGIPRTPSPRSSWGIPRTPSPRSSWGIPRTPSPRSSWGIPRTTWGTSRRYA